MKIFIFKFLNRATIILFTYIVIVTFLADYKLSGINVNYRESGYGFMNTRLKEVDTINDVSILAIGSSHAYRSFDPRIFKSNGVSFYNLGSSAQTPDVTNYLLERYLNQLKPEIVLYEVYPNMIFGQSVESKLDLLSNLELRELYNASKKINWEKDKVLLLNTLFTRVINQIFFLEKEESSIKEDDIYVSGGFVSKDTDSLYFNGIIDFDFSYEIKTSSSSFKKFKENINLINSSGAKCILVLAPLPKIVLNKFHDLKRLKNVYGKLGKYVDYNSSIFENDSLFYDADHLNNKGSEILTNLLISDLKTFRANDF